MHVDYEMQIGRVREETDRTLAYGRPREVGQQRRQRVAERGNLGVVNGPSNCVGIVNDDSLMHHRRLDPAGKTRKAVTPRESRLRLVLIEVDRERGAIEPSV